MSLLKETYSHELHPFWRRLGVHRVFPNSIEFNWGYISFNGGPELRLDHTYEYGVPRLCMCLIWLAIHIELPFIKQRYEDINHSPDYGFVYHDKALWWHWHLKSWCFHMPWSWQHVSHKVWTDGGWVDACRDYEPPYSDKRIVEQHPYTYTLKSGTVQDRTATIYKERREWRWRWIQWLPFPRMVKTAISVNFDDEVGEKSGSWKGGVLGCGYDMIPDETMIDCLRRMELERKF